MRPAQSEVTALLRDLEKERDVLDALNTQLRANQADLKAALAAGKQREQEQAAQMVDLQEQVRDLLRSCVEQLLTGIALLCKPGSRRPRTPAQPWVLFCEQHNVMHVRTRSVLAVLMTIVVIIRQPWARISHIGTFHPEVTLSARHFGLCI